MKHPYDRVRKGEIHFRRSLLRFSVLFVIVLVAGVVTRGFLNQIPLEDKIKEIISADSSYAIEFEKPQIQLAQGLMPIIGIMFKRINFEDINCPSRRVMVQDALLVVNPWRLLRGQFRLGWASLEFVEVELPQSCSQEVGKSSEATSQEAKTAKNKAKDSTDKASIPNSQKELQVFFDSVGTLIDSHFVRYILVDQIKLRHLESVNEQTLISGRLSANISSEVSFDFRVDQITKNQKVIPIQSLELSGELNGERAKIETQASVREGKVGFDFSLNKNGTVQSGLNFEKVPLSALAAYLLKGQKLNYLWFSCQLSIQGTWEAIQRTPLVAQNCFVDGPYGGIEFSNFKGRLAGLDSLSVRAKEIKLDRVFSDRRNIFLSGVVEKYGVLSGHLKFANDQFELEGALVNTELVFSNNNLREIQKVNRLPFFLKGDLDKWQAIIKDVSLENGQFAGDFRWQMNQKEERADGKIAIHKLVLDQRIYQLMLNAEPSLLKIYGKLSWVKNQIQEWSAFMVTPQLKSADYRLNNLKVKAAGKADTPSDIEVKIANGMILKKAKAFAWLSPTTLGKVWSVDEIPFKEFSVKLKLFSDKSLIWNRGYLRMMDGWQLSSEGARTPNREISAWLQWDRPDGEYLKWKFIGAFFDGTWETATPWMNQWLTSHPEFLEDNKNIQFTKPETESLGEKLNEVGKKALDKVKSVLQEPKKAE